MASVQTVSPGALRELRLGQTRYTMLLNERGGIIDDLMVTRSVSEADDGWLLLSRQDELSPTIPPIAWRVPFSLRHVPAQAM